MLYSQWQPTKSRDRRKTSKTSVCRCVAILFQCCHSAGSFPVVSDVGGTLDIPTNCQQIWSSSLLPLPCALGMRVFLATIRIPADWLVTCLGMLIIPGLMLRWLWGFHFHPNQATMLLSGRLGRLGGLGEFFLHPGGNLTAKSTIWK